MGKGLRRIAPVTIAALIVSMLLAVIPLQPQMAEAQSGIPVGSLVQVTTATNVRSGACITFPVLYTATTGTRFTTLTSGVVCGGYTFIRVRRVSDNTTGYLAAELVAIVSPPPATSTPTRTPSGPTRTPTPLGGWSAGDLAQTTTGLNFRSGPGTNYSIIMALSTGSRLLVTGNAQNGQGGLFVPVRYNTTNGWVAADWIAKTGVATSTPTRTPTRTPTVTNTPTSSNTPTVTNTPTSSNTPTVTNTPTNTATPTNTSTPSNTPTPSRTPTVTRTPTKTATPPNGFGPGDIVQVRESLNFRTAPGSGSTIISTLPVGARLLVTGTGLTVSGYFYIPVQYNGTNGWVASEYVNKVGVVTSTPTRTPSRTPTITRTPTVTPTASQTFTPTPSRTPTITQTPAGGFGAGDLVRVNTSLYLRPSAGTGGSPIATLPAGAVLLVTGPGQSASGLFYIPVVYNSLNGWVASNYVTKIGVATATPTATSTPTRTATSTATATFTPSLTPSATPFGGFARGDIVRTNVGVNIRNFPSLTGTVLGTIPSNTSLMVTGPAGAADGYTWIPVSWGSIDGWIATNYVTKTGVATSTPTVTMTPDLSATATSTPTITQTPSLTPTPTAGPGGFLPGDIAHTNTDVNMRDAPGTSANIVQVLDPNTELTITGYGQRANGYFWVPVETSTHVTGWVADNYLTPGVAPALEPTETPIPTETLVSEEPTIEVPPTEEPTLEVPPTEELPVTDTPTEAPIESSPGTPEE